MTQHEALDDDWFTTYGINGLATSTRNRRKPRPVDQGSEPGDGGDPVRGPDPSRVAWPTYGLSVRQLADGQKALAAYARWRLYGVGADQYQQDGHQKCEDMDLARLVKEARDEIADLVNYLTFIDMRLHRMAQSVLEA